MIFSKQLRSQEHTRAFVVGEADERGWEVREEEDNRIVNRAWLHNWRHVENAIMKFMVESMQLRSAGWVEVPPTVVT